MVYLIMPNVVVVRFSYDHCRQILKRAGATQVSSEAVEQLQSIIEDIALDVSKRAVLFARDDERFKVKKEDLRAGAREFLESHPLLGSL